MIEDSVGQKKSFLDILLTHFATQIHEGGGGGGGKKIKGSLLGFI